MIRLEKNSSRPDWREVEAVEIDGEQYPLVGEIKNSTNRTRMVELIKTSGNREVELVWVNGGTAWKLSQVTIITRNVKFG